MTPRPPESPGFRLIGTVHAPGEGRTTSTSPNIMSNYNAEQLEAIVKELDSGKLYVTCGVHGYTGGKLPPKTSGCAQCWQAYYLWDFCTTPPHKRKDRLDELESVIRHAVEFEQKGKFGKDLELFAPGDSRFKIEIERDVE